MINTTEMWVKSYAWSGWAARIDPGQICEKGLDNEVTCVSEHRCITSERNTLLVLGLARALAHFLAPATTFYNMKQIFQEGYADFCLGMLDETQM